MTLFDLFRPIRQNKFWFLILEILFFGLAYFLLQILPVVEKTTIYFSVKPLKTNTEQNINLDPVESGMKIAEMIAGWSKDPGFRQEILEKSHVNIPHFKRKLSARKQNRTNVFWTLKLYGEERQYTQSVTKALMEVFQTHFERFNQNNPFPFAITKPSIHSQIQQIPYTWKLIIAFLAGTILTIISLYLFIISGGTIVFPSQIKEICSQAPTLTISSKITEHEKKLLEQFILSIPSPRLIGTFPEVEKHFSTSDFDHVDSFTDTPIFLIRLGKTKQVELENLLSIYRENFAIIIVES